MNKEDLKSLVHKEVFFPYGEKANVIKRIWCKYIRPESNAVYLIRKYQYCMNGNSINKLKGKFYEIKLLKRYGIWIHPAAEIGEGLRIYHPHGGFITNVKIGKNFTIFQNCTLGVKKIEEFAREKCPHLGDGVTMYANSTIVGPVNVANNVEIASNACLVRDAREQGTYAGVPARIIAIKGENNERRV